MSTTKVDMAKVTQMLDSGWQVILFKNSLGRYTAQCLRNTQTMAAPKTINDNGPKIIPVASGFWRGEECETDDFTPEQALTRLAYKVHGEIIPG